jgi:hypothetical protein
MDVFQLTRALVDIESITGNEKNVGLYLYEHLSRLAAQYGGAAERILVEDERYNVFASWGEPVVTLSTHLDTVPPFFSSREDDEFIWGRGACDVKGIIATMVKAAEQLLADGHRLGATGMVGQSFVKFLENHPWFEMVWAGASDRSAGKLYSEATQWRLDGAMPARVAALTVQECEPSAAGAEAGVFGDGRLRRH